MDKVTMDLTNVRRNHAKLVVTNIQKLYDNGFTGVLELVLNDGHPRGNFAHIIIDQVNVKYAELVANNALSERGTYLF